MIEIRFEPPIIISAPTNSTIDRLVESNFIKPTSSNKSLSTDAFNLSSIAQSTPMSSNYNFPSIGWCNDDDEPENDECRHHETISRDIISKDILRDMDNEDDVLIPENQRLVAKQRPMSRTKSLKRSLDSLGDNTSSLFDLSTRSTPDSCQDWSDDELSNDPWGQFVTPDNCAYDYTRTFLNVKQHELEYRPRSKRVRLSL
mmetsp:Transcript_53113/g.63966  ORF Transcript_53113/g.63966 Transcript_53113/m.63966 type:complete len:201 (+) Transcript_53113:99-701(+)